MSIIGSSIEESNRASLADASSSATKEVVTFNKGRLNIFETRLKTEIETPTAASSTGPDNRIQKQWRKIRTQGFGTFESKTYNKLALLRKSNSTNPKLKEIAILAGVPASTTTVRHKLEYTAYNVFTVHL